MSTHLKHTLPVIALAAMLLLTNISKAAVYQWSVPVADNDHKRAFLWVPPKCQRVKALIVAFQLPLWGSGSLPV